QEIWPEIADLLSPGTVFRDIADTLRTRGVLRQDPLEVALERHHSKSVRHQLRRSDGRWIQQNKRKTSDGGTVAVYADVTEIKAREQALRDSEAMYRRLVDVMPDAIIVHIDSHIVFANKAATHLLRAPDSQALIGRPMSSFVLPEDQAALPERRAA